VYRLLPVAVTRLHKVWYVLRTTPNIQKLLKYERTRSREAQRTWFDDLTMDQVAAAVLQKVPPVGVAGQPARSSHNLHIITIVANARLLQWGLAPNPDASLFDAREGLKAVPEGRQCGPWTAQLDWDLSEVGKRRRTTPAMEEEPPPAKVSAAELFRKYGNDLSGVDRLSGALPANERRALLVGQLRARGASSSDFAGQSWQQLKRTLLSVLHEEAPPPPVVITAADEAAHAAGAANAAAAIAARLGLARPGTRAAAGEETVEERAEGAENTVAEGAVAMEVEAEAEATATAEVEVEVEAEAEATVEATAQAAVLATAGLEAAEPATIGDDDDEADACSSDEDDVDDDEADEPRQKFFCCARDDRPGGFWWCPSCSKCFHHACSAHAEEHRDGSNKVCKPCHAMMMAAPRSTRQRTR
jgi:hypothetical protein